MREVWPSVLNTLLVKDMPVPFGKFYVADKNVQVLLTPKDWDEMDAESECSLHKED